MPLMRGPADEKPTAEALTVDSDAWRQLLRDGAAQLGVELSEAQAQRLALHARELLRWNRRQNLTAITAPGDMAVKHYLDCLAAAVDVPSRGRLLDIGSGAGFPGIPLAVMRPALSGVLLDAVRKKTAFLAHALGLLGLTGWQAHHGRAERLAAEPQWRGAFDVVSFRALADSGPAFELAEPFVKPGGMILALKGPAGEAELQRLRPRLAALGWTLVLRRVSLPMQGGERIIAAMRRPLPKMTDWN